MELLFGWRFQGFRLDSLWFSTKSAECKSILGALFRGWIMAALSVIAGDTCSYWVATGGQVYQQTTVIRRWRRAPELWRRADPRLFVRRGLSDAHPGGWDQTFFPITLIRYAGRANKTAISDSLAYTPLSINALSSTRFLRRPKKYHWNTTYS